MEKRLTTARQWCEAKNDLENEFGYSHIWCRLNAIENILGDNYDLRHLRDLVQAEMEGRAPVRKQDGQIIAVPHVGSRPLHAPFRMDRQYT